MASAILHRSLKGGDLPVAVRGEGVHIYDNQGRRYLDASGGAAVSCLGHSHPAVIEAIQDQLARLPYAHTAFFTNEAAEELAAFLMARAPVGFGEGRVAFLGGGSEAMEAALKLVRQHFVEVGQPARSRIIARRMSYHGNTLGALATGGHMARRTLYQPLLIDVSHISPCYAYRLKEPGESEGAFGRRVADELETEIQRLGPETVAAFVAEPIVGATLGAVTAVPGYFRRIREICDRHGVLMIADEVMCGMGRAGAWFTSAQEGICPDLITIAKGLGAGYQPIGALLASEKVVAPILGGSRALANGHTYMSHASACAGSLAVLKTVEREGLLERVRQKGERLGAALVERFGHHPQVGDIRGRGLFRALELVQDRATKAPFPRQATLADRIKAEAQARGLICYPANGTADGTNGDHVLLAPPFIIEDSALDEIVEVLAGALDASLDSTQAAA